MKRLVFLVFAPFVLAVAWYYAAVWWAFRILGEEPE